nr:ribonuclease H-like domain-containing protein [Tanacetum cinerariifolium]
FNKRTKRVEENLHVEFLENKAIEKGASPNWLFDIDSLTNSMNYVPVVSAGTYSTNFSGTKDATSQEVKKDISSLRYIALPNWVHDALLESTSCNAQDTCKADAPESSGNPNPTASTINLQADPMKTLAVETSIPTISSLVPTASVVSNMETIITASPTPTLRIHKDHPKSQIIGLVDTPIQTRHKSKEVGEQSFIATIHQKTDPALL